MQARPVIAADPTLFGRRINPPASKNSLLLTAADLKLFMTTFTAGFLFVGMMIA